LQVIFNDIRRIKMMNRTIKSLVLTVLMLSALLFAGALPANTTAAITDTIQTSECDSTAIGIASETNGDRVFQGCWSYFPQGPCRAIYSDSQGNFYICGKCSASGNPGSGTCTKISQGTLQTGYWCS
jgi:hypothetical protein